MIEPGQTTHIDHYIPLAKGGKNRLTNLRLMHATCNLKKSDRLE